MSLSGFTKLYNARRNGGIRWLALIQTSDLIKADYDGELGGYTNISLHQGQHFSTYEFREDEAEYRENVEIIQGSVVVQHELKFLLDKMGDIPTSVVSELLQKSYQGFIAIVRTNSNETFLVGYSPDFGKERPLHIVQTASTSGKRFTDPSSESVTMQSTDTSKARPLYMKVDNLLAV